MNGTAIQAERLGKMYQVGALRPGFKTWREGASDIASAPFRLAASRLRSGNGHPAGEETNTIWAIRDISFQVPFGQALGIIGHNGAGKSTLVKVLSRITEPTEGRALVAGRVGSLLEVSAGFHPELTGRENIYLNGAVLGMSRSDIRARFAQIVDFAGVERYLDTPVKRYSSGMSMRLAFSVAAHFEPEVLVVDEVLAVGDTGFHKRCLDKMAEAVADGRTVVFISHNLAAVTELCRQGLLLEKGRVAAAGSAAEVVVQYLAMGRMEEGRAVIDSAETDGSDVRFVGVSVGPPGKEPAPQIDRDEGVEVTVEYEIRKPVAGCQINLELWNYDGVCVLTTGSRDVDPTSTYREEPGRHRMTCRIPAPYLRAGLYSIGLEAAVPDEGVLAQAPYALTFEVVDLGLPEARIVESTRGAIRPVLPWSRDGGPDA